MPTLTIDRSAIQARRDNGLLVTDPDGLDQEPKWGVADGTFHRAMAEFDVSDPLLVGATVTEVELLMTIDDKEGPDSDYTDVHLYDETGRTALPSGNSSTAYSAAAAGSAIVSGSSDLTTVGSAVVTLPGTSSIVETAAADDGVFTLGITSSGLGFSPANMISTLRSPTTSVQLRVTYEESGSPIEGSGSGTFTALEGEGTGTVSTTGTGTGTLASLTGSGSAATATSGTGEGTFSAFTGSGTGTTTEARTGTGSGTFAVVTGSGSGTVGVAGTGASELPTLTGTATGTVQIGGVGDALLPGLAADGVGAVSVVGSGAGSFAALTGSGFEQPSLLDIDWPVPLTVTLNPSRLVATLEPSKLTAELDPSRLTVELDQ